MARLLAGVEAVQGNAQAAHVEMHLGVAQEGGAVGRVHDTRVDAGGAHGVDGLGEAVDLDVEVEVLRAIRSGEVGEGPLQIQRPVEVDLTEELDDILGADADAVHPGVHRQMVRCAQPVQIRRLGVGQGEFDRVDARHDLIAQQQVDRADRRLGKQQDVGADARPAQLHRLVHCGDREHFRTRIQRRARDAFRSVPVGVGLHHRAQLAARTHTPTCLQNVVADGREVDFHPRPTTVSLLDGVYPLLLEGLFARGLRLFEGARVLEVGVFPVETRKPVQRLLTCHGMSLSVVVKRQLSIAQGADGL